MKNENESEENNLIKRRVKKHTKNISIDVEDNIIIKKEDSLTDNNLIEVKNRKFNKPFNLEDTVKYDGYVFKKDSHQTNNFQLIINFRC